MATDAPHPRSETRKAIVVVHGVGDSPLGAVRDCVVQTLAADWGPGHKATRTCGGHSFETIQFDSGPVREILEVNWADIRRPAAGLFGVILHFFALVSAGLHLGRANTRLVGGWWSRFARWYQFTAEAIVIWSPTPMMTCLIAAAYPSFAGVVVVAAAAGTLFLSRLLSNLSITFRWGQLWAVLLIAGGLVAWTTGTGWELTNLSIHVYSSAQLLVTVLALLALAGAIRSNRGETADRRLAGMAFTYAPFVAISALGPAIFALAMAFALQGNEAAANKWAEQFTRALTYDLAFMEYFFGGVVAVLGLFLLAGAVRYLRDARKPDVQAGKRAQDWLHAVLVAAPIGLLFVVTALVVSIFRGHPSLDGAGVMTVYGLSALRIVPFIPFLTTKLRIVVDVLGDVAFYLAPHSLGLAIRTVTQSRFESALKCLAGIPAGSLVIVAHSQGSVLALEGTGRFQGTLATIGSPLGSLYGRFLPAAIWQAPTAGPAQWINIYRRADYIGGPVDRAQNEPPMPEGGHTGYWVDPVVWKQILSLDAKSG